MSVFLTFYIASLIQILTNKAIYNFETIPYYYTSPLNTFIIII